MNKINHYLRNAAETNILKAYSKNIYFKRFVKSSSSSSSSDSDEPLQKLDTKDQNKAKLEKLNNLLKKLIEEDKIVTGTKLNLAQPTNKRVIKEDKEIPEDTKEKMLKAAIDVAKEIGGDVKQTESELLMKLLNPEVTTIDPTKNLTDLIKGMKIDRDTKNVEHSRAEEVRKILQRIQSKQTNEFPKPKRQMKRSLNLQQKHERVIQKIDLFGGESLGIFTNKELKESPVNKTWATLYNRELKLAITHPPSNYFQQMILWTEQGKLWKFPIDNEQGLEEEKKVYFASHVFLEEHLEPWCPPKGPLRHYMELVCVGLSKNPYITVEVKKEHIYWYRDYFEEKKKLLQEVGAIQIKDE